MNDRMFKIAALLFFLPGLLSAWGVSDAAEVSFGLPEVELAREKVVEGRKVLRYEHLSHADWGYAASQRDYFNVVPAKASIKNPPLRVILHGAGKSGDGAMTAGLAAKEEIIHFYGDEQFCVLYLDCRDNRKNDWWWGYHHAKASGEKYKARLTPTEKRLLSSIEWVVQKYNVDRNRIYLSGVSMGGSGSLGLGMCRGDIFAAVSVAVPAGVGHMQLRLNSGSHPDLPPVVNFSSHIDKWSKDQEDFLSYMHEHKFLAIYTWGLFGHTTKVRATDSVVNEFPWLEIRKNEAYPAFTEATTNDHYPGFLKKDVADQQGQLNGYFRWRNVEDSPQRFQLELRLVQPKELRKPITVPTKAVADVTLRRLQRFQAGKTAPLTWKVTRGKVILQSGEVRPGEQGVVTIPGVKFEDRPVLLTVEN